MSKFLTFACLLLVADICVLAKVKECPKRNHLGEKLYHLVHADCTRFYKCDHGVRIEFQCQNPEKEYFDVTLGQCNFKEKVKCTPKEIECPKTNFIAGRLVHLPHDDCSKFYKCDHGEPIQFDCPPGNHFNKVLQICDTPRGAKCQQ